MRTMTSALLHFACASALIAGLTSSVQAQPGAEFFKGKTISYIVPTAAGGGYDLYGRIVSEYMQRHLPGSTFVVKNIPGAAHVIGTNLLYGARPDGLTIGTFNMGLLHAQVIGSANIKFDLRKMSWIGKAAEDPRVFVVAPHTGISSFADLAARKDQIKFAVSGVGGANYIEQMALISVLKLPVRILAGYNGTDDQMAIRRGEIDGTLASLSAYTGFVRNGYARIIAQIGGKSADVPQLMSFAKDEAARALIAMVEAQTTIARLTAGPPEIPADRLEALREAFRLAMNDPELRARTDKLDLPLVPMFGDDVARAVSQAVDRAPAAHKILKEIAGASKQKATVPPAAP